MNCLKEMGKKIIGKVSTGSWDSENNGNALEALSALFQHSSPADWNTIDDELLMKILSFVNSSDLLQCRLISRNFNKAITSSEHFLGSTLFVTTAKSGIDTGSASSFLETSIPFQHCRFDKIDYDVFVNGKKFDDLSSGNYYFRPSSQNLRYLRSIEFQNSFIVWETVKRILVETPQLQELTLSRCKFSERKPISILNEFDEYRVGRVFTNLRLLKISDYTSDLKPVNKLLEKLLGYAAANLEKIHISFDPEELQSSLPKDVKIPPIESEDMEIFCKNIRRLIELNTPVLRTLALDIKHQELLNVILPSVIAAVEEQWNALELTEFLLSPPGCSPAPNSTDISHSATVGTEILMRFLESQVKLKKAALPHFRAIGSTNTEWKANREKICRSISSTVEYLCIPNQEYLPLDFATRFPSLKKLFIGGSTGDDKLPIALQSEMFVQDSTAGEDWSRFRELGLGSTIINGIELTKSIKKFHHLTKFEVTSQLPVIQDDDMQNIITGMPLLQFLSVSACDFLTDYGITGIHRSSCEMMVRLGNYSDISDGILDTRSGKPRPLSAVKGLRSLFLMKNSHITDVGIHFGLRFLELHTACLPYNESITEWGLLRFGEHNPSLQSLVMCSINQRSEQGFVELKNSHPRMRAHKCAYLSFTNDNRPNDYANSIVKFDILKNNFSSSMSGMCSTFPINWLFGKTESQSQNTADEDSDA